MYLLALSTTLCSLATRDELCIHLSSLLLVWLPT